MRKVSAFSQRVLIHLRRKSNFGRTSYPFISGDAFRDLADYSVTSPADLVSLPKAEIVFINSNLAKEFAGEISRISEAKVLIIGNGDSNFSAPVEFNSSVRLVLCQNLVGSDSKEWNCMPIGLENRSLGKSGLPRYFKHGSHAKLKFRKFKVLIPPMSQTNAFRSVFEDVPTSQINSFLDLHSEYLTTSKYFRLVRTYRFILCLEGNGFDTHRVWEALYLECFPVVLNTPWSQELKKMGLPVLIIESLGDLTSELLVRFESEHRIFCSLTTPQLWMPYWQTMILKNL